jgi:death-on-curing protein
MRYLSPQDILVLHSRVLDETGGPHGIRDLGLLISAMERPKASFGRKEAYKTIFEKAAVYLESLASYHVFIDGNKRTAIVASARFLFLNGYEVTASSKEVETFVLKVVLKKPGIPEIAEWFRENTQKTK